MSTYTFICHNISSLILDNKKASQKVCSSVKQNKVNWQNVIELSSAWLVIPALYNNLEKQQLWEHIPEDVYLYLKTVHEMSEKRTVSTQADIRKVYGYLREHNIPVVALKGAAYHVNKLYNGVTFRIESDIDLLIPDNYLTQSYSLLKSNGFYAPKEYEKQWEKHPVGHHLPALLNKSGVEVEIHQFLYPYRLTTLLSSAEVWDDAVKHENLPASPSPTHMIMLILLHSIMGDNGYCLHSLSLRVAQDTLLIRNQYEDDIDWVFIEGRFKAAHLSYIPSTYFHVLEYFFNKPAPAVFKKTWRVVIFIQRMRFNNWLSMKVPYFYVFISPIKGRYCHERNIFASFIREYIIRFKNKLKRIFSSKNI